MTKGQRYKHEMLVRVSDFGVAHRELFPESTPGGRKFAQVTAAVAAIEEHMKNRVLGHASTRGVNATTRAAVFDYMRTLAHAARRMARKRRNQAPFFLPPRRRLKVEVTTARAFLQEAEKRQAQFIAMGLPETFLSDFRTLVDELDEAVNGRLNGKTMRGQARAGIAGALRQGLDLVRDLDLVVAIVAGEDEVVATTWRVARRIEGQSAPAAVDPNEPDVVVTQPVTSAADPPASETASSPAAEAKPGDVVVDRLARAS
jgi:hypothetical protein